MVNASVEVIGPEEAAELLLMNTANFRKPDPTRVDLYAKEMAAGKWKLNGDTIKINGTVLLDGQHRLMAVVKSRMTIQTIVVRGVQDDGKTIDRGKPRTIAQWCTHNGISNGTNVAAAAKLVLMHTKGMWAKGTLQKNAILDSEIFAFIELYFEMLQVCVRASWPTKPVIPQSLMAAVLFVGCGGHEPSQVDEARWFVQALSKGEKLTDEDAVFHLRNRLIAQTRQSQMDAFMKRALLTIAWNKTVKGETCSSAGMRLILTGPNKQKAPGTILQASTI